MKKLIEKVVTVSSPSGRESAIREAIVEEIKPYVDDMKIDPLGNLIGMKKEVVGKSFCLTDTWMKLGL